MKRAYVAFATVTLALGAVVGCKGKGNTGGAGGTGGSTGTSPTTSVSGSTTGSMTTVTTGSMTTATTSTTGTMSSTSTGPQTCMMTYTNVPMGSCSLLAQDCAGNATCYPQADANMMVTGTMCGGMGGTKGPGAKCTSAGDCEKGLFCVGTPTNSVCSSVCCPGQACPGGGTCNVMVNFDTATPAHYALMCSYDPACTLFTANACMAGADCHPDQGLATCTAPSGANVPEGGVCTYPNDCGNMQTCLQLQGANPPYYCRYACDTTTTGKAPGMGGCPTGQSCTMVDFQIPNIGACQPPAGG